jgi:hypothetical protein
MDETPYWERVVARPVFFGSLDRTVFVLLSAARAGHAHGAHHFRTEEQRNTAAKQQQFIEGVEVGGFRITTSTLGEQSGRGFGRQRGVRLALAGGSVMWADPIAAQGHQQIAAPIEHRHRAGAVGYRRVGEQPCSFKIKVGVTRQFRAGEHAGAEADGQAGYKVFDGHGQAPKTKVATLIASLRQNLVSLITSL